MPNGLYKHPDRSLSHPAIGTAGQWRKKPIKLMEREYQSLYFSLAFHVHCCNPTPPAGKIQNLITASPEERVVGLHGLGYGVDEMIRDLQLLSRWERQMISTQTVAIHQPDPEEFQTMR